MIPHHQALTSEATSGFIFKSLRARSRNRRKRQLRHLNRFRNRHLHSISLCPRLLRSTNHRRKRNNQPSHTQHQFSIDTNSTSTIRKNHWNNPRRPKRNTRISKPNHYPTCHNTTNSPHPKTAKNQNQTSQSTPFFCLTYALDKVHRGLGKY